MSNGIMGITKRREPVQWVNGKYVPVALKAKKSPPVQASNFKLLDDSRTSERKEETSNACE